MWKHIDANFAKSVKPVKWQYRARIRNNPCVETLHEVPKFERIW